MSDQGRPFSLVGRVRSIRCALRGIGTMLVGQQNAWVHMVATVTAIVLGLALKIDLGQWCWIIAATVAVWTAEALNTALELLCDVASPEFHPLVEKAKDVAAGAVLVTAIGAVAIALLVFGPHVRDLWAGPAT